MRSPVKTISSFVLLIIAVWLYHLYRLSQQLQAFNSVKIHNLDSQGINTVINTTIKNPTNTRLSITKPFVSLYLPGEPAPFASSLLKQGKVTFEPDSQSVISTEIPIVYTNALSLPMKLLESRAIDVEITARFGLFKLFRFYKKERVTV